LASCALPPSRTPQCGLRSSTPQPGLPSSLQGVMPLSCHVRPTPRRTPCTTACGRAWSRAWRKAWGRAWGRAWRQGMEAGHGGRAWRQGMEAGHGVLHALPPCSTPCLLTPFPGPLRAKLFLPHPTPSLGSLLPDLRLVPIQCTAVHLLGQCLSVYPLWKQGQPHCALPCCHPSQSSFWLSWRHGEVASHATFILTHQAGLISEGRVG